MIYDAAPIALLSSLATEPRDSTNAHIARYVLAHAGEEGVLSVRGVAAACNVGAGSVSRFCRSVGFEGFDELRSALEEERRSFQVASAEPDFALRADEHAGAVVRSLLRAARSVDERAVSALVEDLMAYDTVFTCGLLKAQAAATCLQADLLMLGKLAETSVGYAEQVDRICTAGSDTLVVVFSYTGTYFDMRDVTERLRRMDRPRIWMVCGTDAPVPGFVHGCLRFSSTLDQLGHPFQLQMVAALVAQEYARRVGE